MPFSYNPDEDIPDLAGKVILLTGGKFSHAFSQTITTH
jgi:hypothetical protein